MNTTCPRCGNSVSGVHTCNPKTISLYTLNWLVATKIGGWIFTRGRPRTRRPTVYVESFWSRGEGKAYEEEEGEPDYVRNPLWSRIREVVYFCLAADPSACKFASELPVFNEDGNEVSLAIRVMTLAPAQICLGAVIALGLVAPDVELETEATP